jgi:hypothetical protein
VDLITPPFEQDLEIDFQQHDGAENKQGHRHGPRRERVGPEKLAQIA